MAPMSTCNWLSNDKSAQKVCIFFFFLKGVGGYSALEAEEEGKEENWIHAKVFLVDLTGFCMRP